MHCFILTLFLSAYPSPSDTSHAYSLPAVSMPPADYPYNRKSHNRKALETRKDGITAANDAAVKTRFAGCHGRVPSICEHSSTDER